MKLIQVELLTAALFIAGTVAAQSMWPSVPNHELSRVLQQQVKEQACAKLAVTGEAQFLNERKCFMVDPSTNVPQPTTPQKPLRRI